jgi:1-acyl-sn-glycerol-3-phosphate acyltransferase
MRGVGAGGHDRGPRAPGEQLGRFRARALARGVNPVLYWAARVVLVPCFLVYLRMERIGSEHLPRSGPLLLAANHRSFLDPFVIGALTRRPVYYMAKRELFRRPWQAWLLNALGAFPVDRGAGDQDAIATARAILARGDCVVIFPEGTRVRPGPLGAPRRGIGRLALETGARVVPVAVSGTEEVRRGWRVRPRKVRIRCGAPLGFPSVAEPSPALAAAVTERVWACVSLQWEWLGGARAPVLVQESSGGGRSRVIDREVRAA